MKETEIQKAVEEMFHFDYDNGPESRDGIKFLYRIYPLDKMMRIALISDIVEFAKKLIGRVELEFDPSLLDWRECQWFEFYDSPGEHDPCFVVCPDRSTLSLNNHNSPGVDIARAKFIINACNKALAELRNAK